MKHRRIEKNPTVPSRVDQRSTSKVTSLKGKAAHSDLCNILLFTVSDWHALANNCETARVCRNEMSHKRLQLSFWKTLINILLLWFNTVHLCCRKISPTYAQSDLKNIKYHCCLLRKIVANSATTWSLPTFEGD